MVLHVVDKILPDNRIKLSNSHGYQSLKKAKVFPVDNSCFKLNRKEQGRIKVPFAKQHILAGINNLDKMKISGHKPEKEFLNYIGKDIEEADELLKYDENLRSK